MPICDYVVSVSLQLYQCHGRLVDRYDVKKGKILPQDDKPEMVLPEPIQGGAREFDAVAKSYLTSAELLWKSEQDHPSSRFIAPSAMCLGLGLELFLKARLLERGYNDVSVRKFGHDIFTMWMKPELAEMRRHAQGYALACAEVKQSPIPDPSRWTVDWNVEYLGKLYGNETSYALRYPKGRTQVPYAQPLLWVLYELLDDPKWCLSCS